MKNLTAAMLVGRRVLVPVERRVVDADCRCRPADVSAVDALHRRHDFAERPS